MSPYRPVLIGLRASRFRDEMADWIRGQGFPTYLADTGRDAVEWLRGTPGAVSFLDRDLERVSGEEAWRVVRPVTGSLGASRLVLMAERRTKELWLTALGLGAATLLPLPADREAVLCALRLAAR